LIGDLIRTSEEVRLIENSLLHPALESGINNSARTQGMPALVADLRRFQATKQGSGGTQ